MRHSSVTWIQMALCKVMGRDLVIKVGSNKVVNKGEA